MDSTCVLNCIKTTGFVILNIFKLIGYLVLVYLEKLYLAFFPRPLKSLKGEIILLTGSANGIGKAIAHELANVGATLVCWDYDAEANNRLVAELVKMGTKAVAYTVDISDQQKIVEAAKKVRADVGDVTMIFNNAGIAPYSPFLSLNEELIQKVFKVNLFPLFFLIRQFVPRMIEVGKGHIVTMASMNSFLPNRDQAIYASTKYAMNGFMDSFREEIRDHPRKPAIHVTAVYPIFVQTGMLDGNRVVPRFPSVAPTLTPEYVAREAVNGARRNYSHVFLPPIAQAFAMLHAILPTKFFEKVQGFLMRPNPMQDYSAEASLRGLM